MKTHYLVKTCILILAITVIHGQEIDTKSMKSLAIYLNKEMTPNIQFGAKNNKAVLSLGGKIFDLDLSRKTPDSVFNRPSKTKSGRYIGPIFWRFNFPEVANNKSVFELDSLMRLRLRIDLNISDTIMIGSRLNAFSSHHHIYNSNPHKVIWSGQKSLLLQLKTEKTEGQLQFSLSRIRLAGTFNRTDRFKLSPKYVKALEQRFEKALNKFLQANQSDVLFTIKDAL